MRRPLLILLLALLALGLPAAIAGAGGGGTSPTTPSGDTDTDDNPCTGPESEDLLCPNLRMGTPSDLYAQIGRNRTLLRGANRIINLGAGPMELRGTRRSPLRAYRMRVTQAIRKRSGGYDLFPSEGELFFKPIPGQYRYWKFDGAASLEIWTLDAQGQPAQRVRRSPKLVYCFRDLIKHHTPPSGTPRNRVYPACNQDPDRRRVTLGTSVGWVDRYPAMYHEQHVDVTGLRGRYAFVMIADPNNHLHESNEDDNRAFVRVTLPLRDEGYLPGY